MVSIPAAIGVTIAEMEGIMFIFDCQPPSSTRSCENISATEASQPKRKVLPCTHTPRTYVSEGRSERGWAMSDHTCVQFKSSCIDWLPVRACSAAARQAGGASGVGEAKRWRTRRPPGVELPSIVFATSSVNRKTAGLSIP